MACSRAVSEPKERPSPPAAPNEPSPRRAGFAERLKAELASEAAAGLQRLEPLDDQPETDEIPGISLEELGIAPSEANQTTQKIRTRPPEPGDDGA